MCYAGLEDRIRCRHHRSCSSVRGHQKVGALAPTILLAPPMYFQMIHTRFVNFPRAKRWLWTGLATLIGLIPNAGARRVSGAENFPVEFYQQFGDRMRHLITGMAPIKHDARTRFFAMMQLPLCESYGLVETGSLTYRDAASRKYGSVGKPLRGVNLELTGDGEVMVRRDTFLTRRYFQCAEGENERTFVGNGLVATGDIGRFDSDGYLYLLGRKKALIVTPGGYKIHPEIIEGELNGCSDVAQSVIFPKSGTAQLAAVVVLMHTGPEAQARVKAFAAHMPSARKIALRSAVKIIFRGRTFLGREWHVAAEPEGRSPRYRREIQPLVNRYSRICRWARFSAARPVSARRPARHTIAPCPSGRCALARESP